MFLLRDPYILLLEVILKFKSQSFKSQKISRLFIILSKLLNPYPTSILYTEKAYMHFTLGAYFQLHFRQFYHGSILYWP